MIYRTAHRATYRSLNNNLNTLSYRIAQLTNQIASERRINTPSDDPSGSATVLSTRSSLSAINQYSSNLAVSDLWLADSGNAIQSMKTTLDEIKSKLTMQGSTDTYSEAQRSQIIANEVSELFQSLIQFGNTKIGGSGSYIFGGQEVKTQPFSLKVEAQKVIMGCQNSDKWTGKVVNYGDPTFNNRPDLPVQSQDFLIEVVRAGGAASQYYSNTSDKYSGRITGSSYDFRFTATEKKYNNTQVKFVNGPLNQPNTGDPAKNNGLTYTHSAGETTKVVYVYGSSAQATAASSSFTAGAGTDEDPHVLTISLKTDGKSPPNSVATAADIEAEVNSRGFPVTVGLTSAPGVTNDGSGTVEVGQTSFNHNTFVDVAVDKNTNAAVVTVYLRREIDGDGQDVMAATAGEILSVLQNDPEVSQRLNISLEDLPPQNPGDPWTPSDPAATVSPTTTAVKLHSAEPYTLAQATIDPKGTQNGLVWSIKNHSGYEGALGNNFSVAYTVQQNPFTTSPSIGYDPATNEITVNLAASASIYNKVFAQVYNDPQSGAYKDMEKANEMALREAILTTGNDVMALVDEYSYPDPSDPSNTLYLRDTIDVQLADGNSGLGKVNTVPRTYFSDGYDGYALFRVSQDGGKTWGPAMDFSASEYKNGDMFYNATLGHASFTTSFPGKANDLVFTATQMGSWGNDLRVEYKLPETHPSSASVTVGPNPWNICVTLETDAKGNILTTANEIMEMINNDPVASQLVTADLANYHEGGHGVVGLMDCTALTVGEPYQVDGVTHITPLGHATGTVSFAYSAPSQGCPNISYQAIEQGPGGNDVGIRYTTSADPTYYSSASVANESYQDTTTVRYETTADGKKIMVVHLATTNLPDPCPDENEDREASDKWKELYPLYSCTSARAVTSTAGAVIEAIIQKNTEEPENAIIWPSLERWTANGSSYTAKVGPTEGTVWLSGGNETEDAGNHGVNLRFIMDGTALQVGDVFEVPVGYYRGDDQNIDINANANYRTTMNMSGDKVLGANGADDNILDTVQRLVYALEKNDSELVAKELETLDSAISKLLTMETQIGSRQIRNEFIQQNLDQAKFSSESLLASVEDADFAQLITDLKNAQTVYEAVLGATGLTSKVSLLNYI